MWLLRFHGPSSPTPSRLYQIAFPSPPADGNAQPARGNTRRSATRRSPADHRRPAAALQEQHLRRTLQLVSAVAQGNGESTGARPFMTEHIYRHHRGTASPEGR